MTATITLLGPNEPVDAIDVDRLAALVNDVYREAEKGLWTDGFQRITPAELRTLARAGQLAVLRLDGEVVGCLRLVRRSADLGEFGLLAVPPHLRGQGYGRDLMAFAEAHSRAVGCTAMQLEVLVPREWSHPFKEFLLDWYGRSGYREVRRDSLADDYPHLVPRLATPCDLVVCQKPLPPGA
jgi:GNAT superfamily N-acetyltransferase